MVFMKDVLCQVNRHSGFSCIWNLLSWKRPLLICENQAQNPAGYTFFFHHQIKTCSCWVHVNQLPGLLLAMFISPVKKGKRGSTDPFGKTVEVFEKNVKLGKLSFQQSQRNGDMDCECGQFSCFTLKVKELKHVILCFNFVPSSNTSCLF